MPTKTTSTNGPSGFDPNQFSAWLQQLLSSMRAGNIITAADFSLLKTMQQQWVNHFHQTPDFQTASSAITKNTTTTISGQTPTPYPTPTAGVSPITAGEINLLIQSIQALTTHLHNVEDTSAPSQQLRVGQSQFPNVSFFGFGDGGGVDQGVEGTGEVFGSISAQTVNGFYINDVHSRNTPIFGPDPNDPIVIGWTLTECWVIAQGNNVMSLSGKTMTIVAPDGTVLNSVVQYNRGPPGQSIAFSVTPLVNFQPYLDQLIGISFS